MASPLCSLLFLALASATASTLRKEVIKGMSYGPVPLKSIEGAAQVPADDWFCDEAVPMWGSAGRGDLAVMQKLGANMVRLYGNNPANDHANFLDEAWARGLSVAPGMSDYPYYQQVPGSCLHSTNFDCFTQVRPLYLQNLRHGFLNLTGMYHPALKYMNIINEPDLKIPAWADIGSLEDVHRMCRAIISAFDGMLEAEKEAGVTGPLINFTATFSFAVCHSCEYSYGKPALAQMAQLDDAMRHPENYGYYPRNNITAAYETRFTHSFNTANGAADVKRQFLDVYEEVFPSTPVYIAEYHRVGSNQTQDLELILEFANRSTLFLGVSFFQYQVAYWKMGSEMDFGMFGLGDKVVASMPYFSKTYDIYCLTPEASEASGKTLPDAMAQVYGGEGISDASLCAANPDGVPLDQGGYAQIASQRSMVQMEQFVLRLMHHMGASLKQGHLVDLESFAEVYRGDASPGAFARMASYFGSRPEWIDFDSEPRCVADRTATPSVVGSAIGWVCSRNSAICKDIPAHCNASTYLIGDYVFSRYAKESHGNEDPLVGCSYGGAAEFAPAELYRQWTGADFCIVDGATWISTTKTSTLTTTMGQATSTTTMGQESAASTTVEIASVTTTSRPGSNEHQDIHSPSGTDSTSQPSTKSRHFMSRARGIAPLIWTMGVCWGLLAHVSI